MGPESTGLSLSQLLGIMCGSGLTLLIFVSYARWISSQKILRNERPPLRTKILRPAGYFLLRRIEDLNEKLESAVAQSVLAGAAMGFLLTGIFPLLSGLLLNRFTIAQAIAAPNFYNFYSLLFLIVAAAAWLVSAVLKSIKLLRERRNCRLGMRGEQVVAETLADPRLFTAGYVTFHDVPGDGPWNIDHVVIGPSGIYVLETKTRVKRKPTRNQLDQDVNFDGRVLEFPWCSDFEAAKQAERNAQWVREFIADFAPKNLAVQPVVVVPGWYVKSRGNYPVKAMPNEYLVDGYILPSKRAFTAEQLKPLIRRFDERCRDLEF